jgi:hypothetical protein
MLLKTLIPAVFLFALASCSSEWEIARGPLKEFGQSSPEEEEEPEAKPTAPVRTKKPSGPTQPIKDVPFDVPDVISNLPDENDLQSGATAPSPVQINPADPTKPSVTARPPAKADPATTDSE